MGIIINPYVFASAYDSDAQAFINAVGLTDDTQKNAINDLVLDLKSAGIWTKMQAVWPFVGSTAATQKWNHKNPQDTNSAYRLTFVGTWTHDSSGGDPTSVDAYANTYIAPATDSFWSGIDFNTGGHMSINIIENAPGNAGYDMGAYGGTGEDWMIISSYGNNTGYGGLYQQPPFTTYSNANTIGYYITCNFGDALNYKDGVLKATGVGKTFKVHTSGSQTISLGGSGRVGGTVDIALRKMNFATIGYGLTSQEVTDLTNAVSAYNTALGR